MSVIHLPVRSYPCYADFDKPSDERHISFYETVFPLPAQETAFVLVDCRTTHHNQGWLERATTVLRETIVPALAAAREVPLTIIHAPVGAVAAKYPQCVTYPEERPVPAEPEWPPRQFRERAGPYAVFAKKEELHRDELLASYIPDCRIHPLVEPRDDEFVVTDGPTMRRLLAERGVLHLIYVGFAVNWCVQFKDYGMREQARYGYNCLLLRDCTNAFESADTLDEELNMRIAVREIELMVGWTATQKDFIEACRQRTREAGGGK